MAGGPLAGFLIALLGASRLLSIDAATFGFSALLIGLVLPAPLALSPQRSQTQSGYLRDLREGFCFIVQDRLTRAIVFTVIVTNFLDAPLFSVIMPVYARRVFGSAVDLGLMVAAFGGGSLVGAVLFGTVGSRLPRRPTFIGSFIGPGLPFWLLATLPPFSITVAAPLVSGLASGPINPNIYTVAYERIPASALGRVFGTVTAGAFLAITLGVLGAGYLLDVVGIRVTMFGLAASYLAVTLSLLINPAIAGMEHVVEQ